MRKYKLSKIKNERIVVHCPDGEVQDKLSEMFPDNIIKKSKCNGSQYGEDHCFSLHLQYCSKGWYESNGWVVIPVDEFIRDNTPVEAYEIF